MKKLFERFKRDGAEGPPDGAAAPQNQEPTEPQEPAPKPPPELPLFFMLSHLEEDGPVRLDGVKLGVCEVMGLELDEPKLGAFAGALNALDFPGPASRAPAPAATGTDAGEARTDPAGEPTPADEGGGRVPPEASDRPGDPRRHPRPALLRRLRACPVRRAAGPAGAGRAVRPPPERQAAADVSCSCGTWRHTHGVRRGDAGGGGDAPPRVACRRPPGALAPPGQVAPLPGPRLPPEPHGGGSADGPVHPPGADTRRAGGEDAGVAEGALRVGPVPLLQARAHHVSRGGDRPGGRDAAQGRGAAGPGAALSRLSVRHPAREGRGRRSRR